MTNIDQALLSKFENGHRIPTDDHIKALANTYQVPFKSIKKLQLAEKIYDLIQDENYEYSFDALVLAESRIQYLSKNQKQDTFHVPNEIKSKLKSLDQLNAEYKALKQDSEIHRLKVNEHFNLRYTYESNKIEGNTLSLSETMLVIKEGVTIGGKSVIEHLEAINHHEAIALLYDFVDRKVHFNEHTLLQFHSLILRGIDRANAGRYRNVNVRILGAEHIPPEPYLLPKLMEDYFLFYEKNNSSIHPVLLAAEMHERLVTIHPFIDGNGRTSRLIMNLILLLNGYPLAILKGTPKDRLEYFKTLESVQLDGQPTPFYKLIIERLIENLKERIKLIESNSNK